MRWLSLPRFRHLTGRGAVLAGFADAALSRLVEAEGVAGPEGMPCGLMVNVSPPGLAPHPLTLDAWRADIVDVAGGPTALLRDGTTAFAARTRRTPGAEPTLEVCVTSPEAGPGPVHECVVLQLPHVLGPARPAPTAYAVYVHTLMPDIAVPSGTACMSYVGLTRQGWQKRLAQHRAAAKAGSPLLFHRALRDWEVRCKVVEHRVLAVDLQEGAAMDLEETLVAGTTDAGILAAVGAATDPGQRWFAGTLYPKGLNMIPGGREGLRHLHRMGALAPRAPVDAERREEMLAALMRPDRSGRPNPLLAALWLDADYAERIVCGPEGRLKPGQVREARLLHALGRDVPEIASAVGARDEGQVRRLLSGRTYGRIR